MIPYLDIIITNGPFCRHSSLGHLVVKQGNQITMMYTLHKHTSSNKSPAKHLRSNCYINDRSTRARSIIRVYYHIRGSFTPSCWVRAGVKIMNMNIITFKLYSQSRPVENTVPIDGRVATLQYIKWNVKLPLSNDVETRFVHYQPKQTQTGI